MVTVRQFWFLALFCGKKFDKLPDGLQITTQGMPESCVTPPLPADVVRDKRDI